MIKFEVVQPPRKPIYVEVYEIIQLGNVEDIPNDYWNQRRAVTLDGNPEHGGEFTTHIVESKDRPLKIGDHIRYDIQYDEYRLADIRVLEENPKLVRV